MVHVGKYTVHGSYRFEKFLSKMVPFSWSTFVHFRRVRVTTCFTPPTGPRTALEFAKSPCPESPGVLRGAYIVPFFCYTRWAQKTSYEWGYDFYFWCFRDHPFSPILFGLVSGREGNYITHLEQCKWLMTSNPRNRIEAQKKKGWFPS